MSKVSHYAMRKNADNEYWTIFDIQTGEPTRLDGHPMDKLDELEAIDVLELVSSGFLNSFS